MGWFDDQIRRRQELDQDAIIDALSSIASAVMGDDFQNAARGDAQRTQSAVEEILHYYRLKLQAPLDNSRDLLEQLDQIMRPTGMMHRRVALSGEWYKDGIGALLGAHKDGGMVALIPGLGSYRFRDHESGNLVRLNAETARLIANEAVCFYRPLPPERLGIVDLVRFMVSGLSKADIIMLSIATLLVTLLGMIAPALTRLIFSHMVTSHNMQLFAAIFTMFIAAALSTAMLKSVESLVQSNIQAKLDVSVRAASMMRVLSLPTDFFKQVSSGTLANQMQRINQLCSVMVEMSVTLVLTCAFSLAYFVQIGSFSPALVMPAFGFTALMAASILASVFAQMNRADQIVTLTAKESGLVYSLIAGVQKLKLTGAENRAFAKWAQLFSEKARYAFNPPLFLKLDTVIPLAVSLIGALVLQGSAMRAGVSVADFYAFSAAYGVITAAFLQLSNVATVIANIRPVSKIVKPILEAVPEVSAGKKAVERISGGFELSHVSFRYGPNQPLILDDVSLRVRAGEYVAIVGKTGCGKSTLMRLLLGFETPQKGAVLYDDRDLSALDMRSLRRKIGAVMQNGKLLSGSIFDNIVVAAPWLQEEDAWKAAEMACIADEISAMPMGMSTFISEGSGGISGGQRQMLMIARAIAPNPKLLMLDEATSALDNMTQNKIAQSLSELKCTRLVIAHRLSTIQRCDRIVVLDQGRIVEDGSYDALIAKGGFFSELVARQRLK